MYVKVMIYNIRINTGNLGQGQEVQHLQWCHSMANMNFYKSCYLALITSSHCFRDIHMSNLCPSNIGQGHDVQRSQ